MQKQKHREKRRNVQDTNSAELNSAAPSNKRKDDDGKKVLVMEHTRFSTDCSGKSLISAECFLLCGANGLIFVCC